MVSDLLRQRALLLNMVKRDIWVRYKGSFIGIAWSLITPMLMLAIYTFVFGSVFKARWGGSGSTADFAVRLFCGLILHAIISDCLSNAPNKLIAHANYVKKVVFPLEILPVIVVGNALFHAVLSLFILFLAMLVLGYPIPITVFALPLVLLPLLLFCLGLSWVLAATTVYIRDVAQLANLFSTLFLFLSPIFYPLEMLPAALQPIMVLNPLTVPVEAARQVILEGLWPNWGLLALYSAFCLVFCWLGYVWFQRTRRGFADVL